MSHRIQYLLLVGSCLLNVVATFFVALAAWSGPLILLPILYLAFKPEVQAGLKPVRAIDAFLQPIALIVLPWVVLMFFGLGRVT